MTDEQLKIIQQINIALADLGAKHDLLCVVGSFGDTLDDCDVLDMLEQYNSTGTYMAKIIAKVGDTPEIKRSRMHAVKS